MGRAAALPCVPDLSWSPPLSSTDSILKKFTEPSAILRNFSRVNADRCFAQLCKKKSLLATEENGLKFSIIKRLVVREILDEVTEGTLEDWLDTRLIDLHSVDRYGELLGKKLKRGYVDHPVYQQCHAITAMTWVLDPSLEIYSGYADKSHFHSWLVDGKEKTILEPTPISRDSYYGYKVKNPVEFALTEFDNICKLGEKKLIPRHVYETFLKKVKKNIG